MYCFALVARIFVGVGKPNRNQSECHTSSVLDLLGLARFASLKSIGANGSFRSKHGGGEGSRLSHRSPVEIPPPSLPFSAEIAIRGGDFSARGVVGLFGACVTIRREGIETGILYAKRSTLSVGNCGPNRFSLDVNRCESCRATECLLISVFSCVISLVIMLRFVFPRLCGLDFIDVFRLQRLSKKDKHSC